MPILSVVVAARDCSGALDRCLSACVSQIRATSGEILVAAPAGSLEASIAKRYCQVVEVVGDPLVPALWRAGILAAGGKWVAVTVGGCLPDDQWISALLTATSDEVAAVGGPLELGKRSARETAVFLLRYSPYLRPFSRHVVVDVPGDNAVYRRSAIDSVPDSWSSGFWENEVNAALRTSGHQLVLDPRPLVFHITSGGALVFGRQRFRHGRVYGAARAGRTQRGLRALLAPIVPLILIVRIARRVNAAKRYRSDFLRALPWLFAFAMAWTAGETVGLLSGSPGPDR